MKTLTTSLLAVTAVSSLIAKDPEPKQEREHKHCFSPKVFYRKHTEEGYKYETSGIGLQYRLKREEGINVRLSVITNPQSKNVLAESENSIFFKIPIRENHSLYPIITSKYCTHNVDHINDHGCYIQKQTFLGGIGWEWTKDNSTNFMCELQGFRDLRNALLVHQEDKFWGKSYSNPYGGRLKIGLHHSWESNAYMEMEGYYGKTFSKCYSEHGGEFHFGWKF